MGEEVERVRAACARAGRSPGDVVAITWEGDPRRLMDRSPEALARIRNPLLRPLGYRFEAPGRVALYLLGDRVWAIENFADAPAHVALARTSESFPPLERLVLPPEAEPEIRVEPGRIEGMLPPRTLIAWRARG